MKETHVKRLGVCENMMTDLNKKQTTSEVEQKNQLEQLNQELTSRLSASLQSERGVAEENMKSMEMKLSKEMIAGREESATMLQGALEDYTTKRETKGTYNKVLKQVELLKEFVRNEFADHTEGMTMTHSKVESLEERLKEDHATSFASMREEVHQLRTGHETHTKASSELKQTLKLLVDQSKEMTEERIQSLEKFMEEKATNVSVLKMKEELLASIETSMTELHAKSAEQAETATTLEKRVTSEVASLTESVSKRAEETDSHITSFRASLTDEIAQALTECNVRVESAERATKAAAEEMARTSATRESVAEVEAALQEKLSTLDGEIQRVVQGNASVVTSLQVEETVERLRNEMIRRDELLESQLVDAHAQMQRDAQAIIAPAKSEVESMRQQVSCLLLLHSGCCVAECAGGQSEDC